MSKKDITPKDTRYVPLTQQRLCCVPTCIQMVMIRHNIPLKSAELIGYYLRLTIPKDMKSLFWNARISKIPKSGYGTQIGKKEFTPNTAFKKIKIPLEMNVELIDKFKNLDEYKKYLKKVIKEDKDIIVCYDWGTLFNERNHNGHVCVLDKVNMTKCEVRIIDPDQRSPKWRVVKIAKLYKAMKYHGKEKSGGFWELKYIEKK